jgi:hypothetical protein
MRLSRSRTLALFLILWGNHLLSAKQKHKPAPQQDQIAVAAHLALPGASVVRFTATRRYDRSYVYVERGPGQPITLLDITDPAKPVIVSQLDPPAHTGSLVAAAGTSAISTSTRSELPNAAAQTIRIMDLSDTAHPKITQQFENVTAVEKISGSVTLLANPEGIWILTQQLADDPQLEERYARKVIYGESMY